MTCWRHCCAVACVRSRGRSITIARSLVSIRSSSRWCWMSEDAKHLRVVGSGLLANTLRSRLSDEVAGSAGLTVVAYDEWRTGLPDVSCDTPVLPVWTELDKVVV